MAADVNTLIDLSTINHNNPNMIVKKAAIYIGEMEHAEREIVGINFKCLPKKKPSMVRIYVKSSKDDKFVDEYTPPKSYPQQFTLACFLFAVANLLKLGNRAHIFCTNASGRGDTKMSISTKHCKSEIQKKLVEITTDGDFLETVSSENQTSLPEGLSPLQRDLINQSTSGEINTLEINRIKSNHSVSEIEIYYALEDMKENFELPIAIIPKVSFRKISIQKVVEMLNENELNKKLNRENKKMSKEIDDIRNENENLENQITKIRNRSLLKRIFNKD